MRKPLTVVSLTLTVLVAGTALASPDADVMATVNQFVDGFNKGDTKSAGAACAEHVSIIDEFPPHEWHGAGACEVWMKAYDADAKKNAITDGLVTLGKPKHLDVAGDRAYVVIPAAYAYTKAGKPVKETDSAFTLVLHKGAHGWRIVAWSWAKN